MSSTADQVQQMVQQALRRFDELASSDLPLSQTVAEMADVICRTVAGLGCVVWMPSDQATSGFRAAARTGHAAPLAIADDRTPQPPVEQAIRQCLQQQRSAIVAPDQPAFAATELHHTVQFFLPIDAAGRFSGVLHLICSAEVDPKLYRQFVAFAQQGARALGVYLARRQTELLQADAASAERIVRISHQLVKLRDPQHVIHELANQARQSLEARRVAVVGYWRRRPHVAFSDTIDVNQRAVLVRTVQMLADTARQRQVPLTFVRGEDLNEDDMALAPLLQQLWDLGGASVVCITPVRDADQIIGVMVAEYTLTEHAGRRAATQQNISQHGGPLLRAAIDWHHRPLRRTSNLLAVVRDKPLTAGTRAAAAIIALAAAAWVLFFLPVPIYIWADARLEPVAMQDLTAPVTARVADVLVTTGQSVIEGQPLIELDTTDLLFERSEIVADQAEAALTLDAALAAEPSPQSAAEIAAARLRLHRAETQLAHIDRKIAQATIRAPIDGVVLTERPEQIVTSTVSEGDQLLTIGDLSRFELVMEVREEDLALLEDTIRSGHPVTAEFLSRPWPDLVQQATIDDTIAISPTSVPDERQTQHVFLVTTPIELQGLSEELVMANPSGRAKMETRSGSIAFRYGRRVWRFIQLTLLF